MIPDLKTALKYLILFLIGVSVLYFAFRGQDLTKIWQEIKSANFLWVIISALTVLLAYILRALRWQLLYQSIHYRVGFWNVYHAVMIGYLANMALPRFGEIVRCSVIQRAEKVPIFSSIGTVITERLFDVLVLFLTTLALLVFQYNIVFDFLHDTLYLGILNKINSLSYVWIMLILIVLAGISSLLIYLLKQKFGRKLLKVFVSLRQGFSSYGKLKNKWLFLTYTFGIWFLYFCSIYFAFSAIEPTANLQANAAFTAIVFSGFAMAAPVQGGIGVFHWAVAQSLVLYAVSFHDGLAYATIIHSSQVLIILVLGSVSLFLIFIKKKSKN